MTSYRVEFTKIIYDITMRKSQGCIEYAQNECKVGGRFSLHNIYIYSIHITDDCYCMDRMNIFMRAMPRHLLIITFHILFNC